MKKSEKSRNLTNNKFEITNDIQNSLNVRINITGDRDSPERTIEICRADSEESLDEADRLVQQALQGQYTMSGKKGWTLLFLADVPCIVLPFCIHLSWRKF